MHNLLVYRVASSRGFNCNLNPSCSFLVPLLKLNLQNEGLGLCPRNSLSPLRFPVSGTGEQVLSQWEDSVSRMGTGK